jgi:hypothetical protein
MQIMPETYTVLRARYALGANPYDPRDNILAGAAYLHELHDRYGAPGFLAAHNAGPRRYEDHLRTGRPLPLETRRCVAMLAPIVDGEQMDDRPFVVADVGAWLHSLLFPVQSSGKAADNKSLFAAPPERQPTVRAPVDLSASRRSLATCSCAASRSFSRNERNRASSEPFGSLSRIRWRDGGSQDAPATDGKIKAPT